VRRPAKAEVGGHGTGAAYAERYAGVNNLQAVMGLSMTVAPIGMMIGVAIPNLVPVAGIRNSRALLPGGARVSERVVKAVTSSSLPLSQRAS